MRHFDDRFGTIKRMAPLVRLIIKGDADGVAHHLIQWWTEKDFVRSEDPFHVNYTNDEIVAIRTATTLIQAVINICSVRTKAKFRQAIIALRDSDDFYVPELIASGEHIRHCAEILETFGL